MTEVRAETLNGLLARAAAFPEAGLRLLDRRERSIWVSWDEIFRAALNVGAGLHALGVERGQRVALVYPTGLDFFHAFFGILLAGAVPVPLYPPARLGRQDDYHRRTAGMLRATGVRLVLTGSRLRRHLAPAVDAARPALGCQTLEGLVGPLTPCPSLPSTPARPGGGAPPPVGEGQTVPAEGRFEDGAERAFRTALLPKQLDDQRGTVRAPPAERPAALAGFPNPDRACGVGPSDLALVQFSSGTTSDPKPVALTHRAIVAQVRSLNALWPDPPAAEGSEAVKHSGVSWLPLYHDMGLIGCVLPALERPGVLTLIAPEVFVARPAVWLRAISRYRATLSVAPNFAYGLCTDKIRDEELDGVDLSGWRMALNGSEPVATSVLRAFQRRFAAWGFRPEALTPVYGLSEASLAVTFSDLDREFRSERFDRQLLAAGWARADDGGVELVSVGRPLEGTGLRVVDGNSRLLPPGQVGRIEIRGPSLMDGYLGRPDLADATLRDGWLDTGDLGFVHDGELFLTSRAKDVVILRGRNYSPAEIEQAAAVPGVRRECIAAVSWLPEGAPGEILGLFVEHRRGASAGEIDRLPGACAEAVLAAVGLRPDRVAILEPGTLPRTSSGKLRRREVLARHLAGELDDLAALRSATADAAEATGAFADG